MCIRDRGGLALRTQEVSPDAFAEFAAPIYSEACQRYRDKTCLLYTSDAADERSSVDLGGRRIIKKKTHISEQGVRSSA